MSQSLPINTVLWHDDDDRLCERYRMQIRLSCSRVSLESVSVIPRWLAIYFTIHPIQFGSIKIANNLISLSPRPLNNDKTTFWHERKSYCKLESGKFNDQDRLATNWGGWL